MFLTRQKPCYVPSLSGRPAANSFSPDQPPAVWNSLQLLSWIQTLLVPLSGGCPSLPNQTFSHIILRTLSLVKLGNASYRGELKMEEYLERTGEELEDGEDLGETTLDDGRTVFLVLQSITPDWIKNVFFILCNKYYFLVLLITWNTSWGLLFRIFKL